MSMDEMSVFMMAVMLLALYPCVIWICDKMVESSERGERDD